MGLAAGLRRACARRCGLPSIASEHGWTQRAAGVAVECCGCDGVARRELVPSTAMAAPGAEAAAAVRAANGKGGGREWNEGAGRERANAGMLKALSGSVWPDRAEERRHTAIPAPRGGQGLKAVGH